MIKRYTSIYTSRGGELGDSSAVAGLRNSFEGQRDPLRFLKGQGAVRRLEKQLPVLEDARVASAANEKENPRVVHDLEAAGAEPVSRFPQSQAPLPPRKRFERRARAARLEDEILRLNALRFHADQRKEAILKDEPAPARRAGARRSPRGWPPAPGPRAPPSPPSPSRARSARAAPRPPDVWAPARRTPPARS